jgi:haloacetate dehalogenase
MAIKAYHWTFLAQPHPLPERMIASDPVAYLEWTLASWSTKGSLEMFDWGALENYRRFYTQPERIREYCEDLSGGRRHRPGARRGRFPSQPQDRGAGHLVWSDHRFPAETDDPIGLWRTWAKTVTGQSVEAGHFVPEENPEGVLTAFVPFFSGAADPASSLMARRVVPILRQQFPCEGFA